MDGSFTEKIYDRLSNDTITKLQKASYRAVDLIEMFFPDPDDYSKRVKLGPYQKDFIDCIQYGFPLSQYKFNEVRNPPEGVIYITRRQVGKSWGCGWACGALGILGPTSKGCPPSYQGIVAASEDEAEYLIDKVKICYEESDFNDFLVGKNRVDRIKLANKSMIRSHTCSHKSIRGPKYHYIYIDESAQMDEDILFSAALPTVEHGERWVAITTPQGNKGKLIEFYDKGLVSRPIICTTCRSEYSQNHFNVTFPTRGKFVEIPKDIEACPSCKAKTWKYGVGLFSIPYLDPWKTPIIDQVKLKRKLDSFSWSPWAREELLGEILDEASMVILKEWIDRQINVKARNKMVFDPAQRYVIGMDYGRLHDASSFAVTHLNKKTNRIVLDYMRTVSGEFDYETDYDGIHEHVEEIFKFYNPSLAVIDSTGLGYSQVERIQKDFRLNWGLKTKIYNNVKGSKNRPRLGFNINRQSKPELIGNLLTLFSIDPARLQIPPTTEPEIKELVTELLRFECEILDAGYIKYGTQNYHDDRLIALALSLYGHKKKAYSSAKPRGFQYKSIVKKKRDSKSRYYKPKIRLVTEVMNI